MSFRMTVIGAALFAAIAMPAHAQDTKKKKEDSGIKPVKIGGYSQTDYRFGDDAGEDKTTHEFHNRRTRIGISGQVHKKIKYKFVVQGDGLAGTSASLLQAFFDVKLAKTATLRMGQFKYDFDMTGRASSSSLRLIDRAHITSTVVGNARGTANASGTGGGAFLHERGVALTGKSKNKDGFNWGYFVGAMQGNLRDSDNNNKFGAVASVDLRPTKGFRLHAGFLYNDGLDTGATGTDEYTAWTVGAEYNSKVVGFRGEYYNGERDTGSTTTAKGIYGRVTYHAGAVDLMGRYQWMEDTKFGTSDNTLSSIDLGVKYFFVRKKDGKGTSLSANYMIRDADTGFTSGTRILGERGLRLSSGDLVKGVFMTRIQVQF